MDHYSSQLKQSVISVFQYRWCSKCKEIVSCVDYLHTSCHVCDGLVFGDKRRLFGSWQRKTGMSNERIRELQSCNLPPTQEVVHIVSFLCAFHDCSFLYVTKAYELYMSCSLNIIEFMSCAANINIVQISIKQPRISVSQHLRDRSRARTVEMMFGLWDDYSLEHKTMIEWLPKEMMEDILAFIKIDVHNITTYYP